MKEGACVAARATEDRSGRVLTWEPMTLASERLRVRQWQSHRQTPESHTEKIDH